MAKEVSVEVDQLDQVKKLMGGERVNDVISTRYGNVLPQRTVSRRSRDADHDVDA